MKRICAGFYEETYRGERIEVCRMDDGNAWNRGWSFFLPSGDDTGPSEPYETRARAQEVARRTIDQKLARPHA